MSSARTWIGMHRIATVTIALTTLLVVFAGALGVAKATDSPSFCRSACHEMQPYAEAWDQGPHAGISCVECHVNTGAARLTHKVSALGEVVSHVKGGVTFPLVEHSPIPNERCVRCHENVQVTSTGFNHAKHADGRNCEDCHRTAGHEVDPAALKAAGIFNPDAQRQVVAARIATVDGGSANVPGHVTIACSRCHDLAKTGCGTCHAPKHEGTGPAEKLAECGTCHAAGEKFVFTHPTPEGAVCGSCHQPPTTAKHTAFTGECQTCHTKGGASWKFTHTASADCTTCHTRPAKHRDGACTQCHAVGKSWAFNHPSTSSNCTTCHQRPANHRAGSCTSCHRTGVSWAFSHPAARANCTNCHPRPAGHRSGSCTTCHRVARSWAFAHPSRGSCASCHARPANHRSGSCTSCHRVGSWRFSHPGSSASCTNCHARPGGHRSGSCLTCHRVGSSWAFRHPTSSACASCHNSPASHYGSSCASCHSPSRAWANATFNHPGIPGGQHTYRSFACSNCHPSGYSSHTCAKCHDSASGPRDDD